MWPTGYFRGRVPFRVEDVEGLFTMYLPGFLRGQVVFRFIGGFFDPIGVLLQSPFVDDYRGHVVWGFQIRHNSVRLFWGMGVMRVSRTNVNYNSNGGNFRFFYRRDFWVVDPGVGKTVFRRGFR